MILWVVMETRTQTGSGVCWEWHRWNKGRAVLPVAGPAEASAPECHVLSAFQPPSPTPGRLPFLFSSHRKGVLSSSRALELSGACSQPFPGSPHPHTPSERKGFFFRDRGGCCPRLLLQAWVVVLRLELVPHVRKQPSARLYQEGFGFEYCVPAIDVKRILITEYKQLNCILPN